MQSDRNPLLASVRHHGGIQLVISVERHRRLVKIGYDERQPAMPGLVMLANKVRVYAGAATRCWCSNPFERSRVLLFPTGWIGNISDL